MAVRALKIAIENCVCQNTGDAAIMQAIVKIVDTASGRLNDYLIYDTEPASVRRLYRDSNGGRLSFHPMLAWIGVFKVYGSDGPLRRITKPLLSRLSLARVWAAGHGIGTLGAEADAAVRAYAAADVVITTGGTYLVENYNISPRLKQFEIGQMFGKRTIFFTQSLGPFAKPSNISRLKQILRHVPLLLLRDARSLRNLAGIVDPAATTHVVADSVFALADVAAIEAKLGAPLDPLARRRVAVSVRQWAYVAGGEAGMARYANAVAAMVETLVRDHACHVTFLSTCQGVPEYHHNDALLAAKIRDGLSADVQPRVDVDGGFHTPDALMQELRGFDFVISTRMHMMIMALNVGTPVLPIVYEFKTEELATKIGLAEVTLNIDTVEAGQAVATLGRFIGEFDIFGRRALEGSLGENREAMGCAELIRPFLPAF